jgi:haloalkane dehalogenase
MALNMSLVYLTPQQRKPDMKVLRTPDAAFQDLPDYSFAAHYLDVANPDGPPLRLHYVDEGPRNGNVVLLLHGEPSWSYLYRKMIPLLVARGHRVLAPDLIGFGKSDKPAMPRDYTFERHVDWTSDWLRQLGVSDITMFCQDWGGLIGLRLVARFPDLFAAVIAGNTGLPTGGGSVTWPFRIWLAFSRFSPILPIGRLVSAGTTRGLSDGEKRAYDAPFPQAKYKAGARRFPALVPVRDGQASVAECKAAWKVLEQFDKPFLTAFSTRDPITRGGERVFQARIPGAKDQPHVTIRTAGHFLQEDKPEELVQAIDGVISRQITKT